MSRPDQIPAFIEALARYDGFAPFSDAKLPIDPVSDRVVVVVEADAITAIGAAASHLQGDGSVHGEIETACQPVMRFPAFEGAVLDATLSLVETFDSFSVWSRRSSLDAALVERGFVASRVLDFLVVHLPLEGRETSSLFDRRIRTFVAQDTDDIVSVNGDAFADHREAGALDAGDLKRFRSEPWFDAEGLFIAESDGAVGGFCWTRVHPDGDGEIFRIAVAPSHQGRGLGMALLNAGFGYLAERSDVRRGVLWVDRSNTAATALYRSVGMERERSNREFTPG